MNVFELLGSNAIIYVQTDDQMVVMNTQDVTPHEPGEEIHMKVLADKVHVFDPDSERTITN